MSLSSLARLPYRAARGLAGTVAAALLLAGCGERAAPPPTMDEVRSERAPVHESWDVTLYISETATLTGTSEPRLLIEAGYMAAFEEPDSSYTLLKTDSTAAERSTVTAHLFDAAGDTSATVTAREMIYRQDRETIQARGSVRVRTPEGRHLETEVLLWDGREKRVRAPGFARITTPTEEMQGYQLDADEDLDNYTLARVTGKVVLEDE